MTHGTIGILHPGEMGASLGAALAGGISKVYWVGHGRSDVTRCRAERVGLHELPSLAEMCASCGLIVGICPPQFALEIAGAVMGHGFRGVYLDANAISPGHACQIGALVSKGGAHFVDGSVIGPPAWQPATTEIYLSGAAAVEIAGFFAAGPLTARVIGEQIGAASALKMCDSAFNKTLLALLYETLAGAERLGVREALQTAWERDPAGVGAVSTANNRVGRSARKAWRFAAEIDEVIDTVETLGISAEFHRQARRVFERLTGFRGAQAVPDAEAVIAALHKDAFETPPVPGKAIDLGRQS